MAPQFFSIRKELKAFLLFRKSPKSKKGDFHGGDLVMAEEQVPDDLEIADELIAERRTERPGETPADMTSWQRPITGFIDRLNDFAGKALCLLMVPLLSLIHISEPTRPY